MTREEFIEILRERGYSYEMEGDKIIVTYGGNVDLGSLKTLPPGVHFENGGTVDLGLLKTLPPGVHFKNDGYVYLSALKTLPSGVAFKNRGHVLLSSLETLPPGVQFKNGGDVRIKGLSWVNDNEGIKIEGVENKRLVDLMIKQGVLI